MNVIKEHIITPAWNLVKEDVKIKKMYFLPGLLWVIFLTVILVYQTIYTYVVIFNKKEQVLELILKFFHSDYFLEVSIWLASIFFINFFILPIFEWALISYINKKSANGNASSSDALWVGIFNFFPLLEYSSIFSEFKLITIINVYLFLLRFIGLDYIGYLNYSLIGAIIFSFIINVLFAYTKYSIVIEGKSVLGAIGVSSKMAILNPKITVKLYFLMFVLNLRVFVNFIIFLLFPVIIFSAILYITSQIFLLIALVILWILFFWFIIFLAYMSTVLEIFKATIWYFAYEESKKKLSDHPGDDWHHWDSHHHDDTHHGDSHHH